MNPMQTSDVTIRIPYDILLNRHKSLAETAADIRRQAATVLSNARFVIGQSGRISGHEPLRIH